MADDATQKEAARIAELLKKQKFPNPTLNPVFPFEVIPFPFSDLVRNLGLKMVFPPEDDAG